MLSTTGNTDDLREHAIILSTSERQELKNSTTTKAAMRKEIVLNSMKQNESIDLHENQTKTSNESEILPEPLLLRSSSTRNGTNICYFYIRGSLTATENVNMRSNLSMILYILLAIAVLVLLIIGIALLSWRHYKTHRKTDSSIVVVKSLKNEREQCRIRDRESWGDRTSGISSPVTLNSESNLQTVKVKTLAITVRNNLEEDGTEV